MAATSSGSGGRKGSPLKLPRLHLKAELLQARFRTLLISRIVRSRGQSIILEAT